MIKCELFKARSEKILFTDVNLLIKNYSQNKNHALQGEQYP